MRTEKDKVFYSFGLATEKTGTIGDSRKINTMKENTARDFCLKETIPDIACRVSNGEGPKEFPGDSDRQFFKRRGGINTTIVTII